jgi:carboxyl-terminal processing protease
MHDAAKEVQTALTELKKDGCTGIILDLRGNPGGFLLESVKIVNLFVPQGELVVYTKGRTDKDIQEYKTPNRPVDLNIPLVVLINGRSASASEIVSGTLQDLDRAVVMGSNSFGKGLVQTTRQLPYRSQMKITTAKYYTPSGRCIQALNYSNRNTDGSVGKVADSLRQAFTTKKGRTVYDGGGIKPDKDVDALANDEIIQSLQNQFLIFDFAVNYVNTHTNTAISERFNINDADFNNFLTFTEKQIERVNTVNDIQFDNLKKNLKKTTENQSVETAVNGLGKAMVAMKLSKIREDKAQLMDVLSLEIIRVYGLSSMHSKAQFLKDVTMIKAIETLQNETIYNQYLK